MADRNDKIVEIDSIVNIFASKNKGMKKKSQFEGDDMQDMPPTPESEEEELVDEAMPKEEEKKEESVEEEGKEKEDGVEEAESPTEEISESLVENLSNIAEENDLSGTDVVDIVKDIVEDEKGEAELVEEVEKEITARKARKAKLALKK